MSVLSSPLPLNTAVADDLREDFITDLQPSDLILPPVHSRKENVTTVFHVAASGQLRKSQTTLERGFGVEVQTFNGQGVWEVDEE